MVPHRVTLITMDAWDVPKLRAFYKRLDWHETDWNSDNYAVFKTGRGMIALF